MLSTLSILDLIEHFITLVLQLGLCSLALWTLNIHLVIHLECCVGSKCRPKDRGWDSSSTLLWFWLSQWKLSHLSVMMWEFLGAIHTIPQSAVLSHISIDSVAFTGELRGKFPIGTCAWSVLSICSCTVRHCCWQRGSNYSIEWCVSAFLWGVSNSRW